MNLEISEIDVWDTLAQDGKPIAVYGMATRRKRSLRFCIKKE